MAHRNIFASSLPPLQWQLFWQCLASQLLTHTGIPQIMKQV
jgi:hypothetical protein